MKPIPFKLRISKKSLCLALTCGCLALFSMPAWAAVTMGGNVVFQYNDSSVSLRVGETGSGNLDVDGGSDLTELPNAHGQPSPFGGITMGFYPAAVNNRVAVSGSGSYLDCGGITSLSGSGNQVYVFDGARMKAGIAFGSPGTYNLAHITDPGTVLDGSVTLNSSHNSLTVWKGARMNGIITVYGADDTVTITGTNTVVSAPMTYGNNLTLSGSNTLFSILDGASVSAAALNFGGYGENHAVVDGNGTQLNVRWLTVRGPNDRLTISGGAQVNVPWGGYPASTLIDITGLGARMTITDPDTRVLIGSPGAAFATNPKPKVGIGSGDLVNNRLTVSNGAQVTAWADLEIGSQGRDNTMLVTGAGAQWIMPSNTLNVGRSYYFQNSLIGTGNQLSVGLGGKVATANASVSLGNMATVSGSFVVSNGVGSGQFSIAGVLNLTGSVEADVMVLNQLYALNGNQNPPVPKYASILFPGGTLATHGLNGADPGRPFVVGDGTNTANYLMKGGTHAFAGNLVIASNSILGGCGTVSGRVTNYGTILLTNGCAVDFTNSVVNFGRIIAPNTALRFLGGLVNYGVLLDQSNGRTTLLSPSGSNVVLQFNTILNWLHDVEVSTNLAAGAWWPLTNGVPGTGGFISITDDGGAGQSQRFYRVRYILP